MNQEEIEIYAQLKKMKIKKIYRSVIYILCFEILFGFAVILSSCNKETVNQPNKEVMVKTTVIDNDGIEHDSQMVILK